ncbi:MAG: type II toxin-antitoxin system VapC family toxin [Pseudonocardiaceae bacterium]
MDASVLANALTDDGPVGQAGRAELARDVHWAAPEHVVIEAFLAVRGRHLGGKISSKRAQEALDALACSAIELVSTAPLLPRMWQLRDNISGYDAAYVAAAEANSCPLVTADARLGRTPGLHCDVRLAAPVD